MLFAPSLNEKRKKDLLNFARRLVTKGNYFWGNIVFSGEKTFTLVRGDGLSSYWQDIRTELHRFPTRQEGGKSVML